jgi:hypothetical protein
MSFQVKKERETFTKSECAKWLQNKTRNPRTNRAIKQGVPGGPYNQLENDCKIKSPKSSIKATRGVPNSPIEPSVQEAFDKYCRCVMKVRPGLIGTKYENAEFAICNKTVLKSRKLTVKPKYCQHNFNEYDLKALIAYANNMEKVAKWDWQMSAKARNGHKATLVRELSALESIMNAKYREKSILK